jgi:hypothetical protein
MYHNHLNEQPGHAEDELPRLRAFESSSIQAYERIVNEAPRRTRVELINVLNSHRRRLTLIEDLLRRYQDDNDSRTPPPEAGQFADLLHNWDTTPHLIAAFASCERFALAWYHQEAKRGHDYVSRLVTDHLMPEQARTCTIMDGILRRSNT